MFLSRYPELSVNLITVFILNLLAVYVLFQIIQLKNNLNYKIVNFKLNTLYILFFISFYIIFLSVLRYFLIGQYIDLKSYYFKYSELFFKHTLLFLVLISLYILIFLIFIYCYLFLLRQLKMRHIYYKSHYAEIDDSLELLNLQKKDQTFFEVLQYKLNYSYQKFIDGRSDFFFFPERSIIEIRSRIMHIIYNIKISDDNYISKMHSLDNFKDNPNIMTLIFDLLLNRYTKVIYGNPFYLLLFIFIFDCCIHNLVLHFTLNFLFFYTIYSMLRNFSEFIQCNDDFLDAIIYHRYYCPDVYYVNLTDAEEKFILCYIKLNFANYVRLNHIKNSKKFSRKNLFRESVIEKKKRIDDYYTAHRQFEKIAEYLWTYRGFLVGVKHLTEPYNEFPPGYYLLHYVLFNNATGYSFTLSHALIPTYIEGMKKYVLPEIVKEYDKHIKFYEGELYSIDDAENEAYAKDMQEIYAKAEEDASSKDNDNPS